MRSWKRLLALASTVGAVLAAAVALVLARIFTSQDIIDVAAVAVVVAALIGLYGLRRHAREVLVYDRDAATSMLIPTGRNPGSRPSMGPVPPPPTGGHRPPMSRERF